MKTKDFATGALLGALLTAPQIALMYLADQLAGLPFVPFDLFNWMTPLLPGPLITFGIDLLIDALRLLGMDVAATAKIAEQLLAVLLYFTIGVITGVIFYVILKVRKIHVDWITGLAIGALFGMPVLAIVVAGSDPGGYLFFGIIWLLILYLGWGLAFALAYRRLNPEPVPGAELETVDDQSAVEVLNRRQFLVTLGVSAATITVVGAGLGAALARRDRSAEGALDGSQAHEGDETPGEIFPNSNDPVVPAPGTRPEYTPIKDHYKVFLQLEPTVIDGATWALPLTGLVKNPLMLTLDDIRENYPSREQYVTLSCISGRVGTTLISTTQWTGVSVQDILDDAGLQPEARYLHMRSGDGFFETISLDLIYSDERIMFCYAWDGNTLPVDHGFPLRIWIPDRFGMKQPKWITSLEVTSEYEPGYWVERRWDEVAQVKTTSVIDTVAVDALIQDGDQQRVPIGGIAWAGDRGISKVEVRVDGGSWEPAQLRAPLSETTWVIWRYEWPYQAGHHLFEVRCAEGNGISQIEETRPARPKGATGIHSREADL